MICLSGVHVSLFDTGQGCYVRRQDLLQRKTSTTRVQNVCVLAQCVARVCPSFQCCDIMATERGLSLHGWSPRHVCTHSGHTQEVGILVHPSTISICIHSLFPAFDNGTSLVGVRCHPHRMQQCFFGVVVSVHEQRRTTFFVRRFLVRRPLRRPLNTPLINAMFSVTCTSLYISSIG